MASVTSAAATIPSFTGLKAGISAAKPAAARVAVIPPAARRLTVKASLKDFSIALVASAATAILASNALAIEVVLGADDGGLVFIPQNFEVAAGEKIIFKNNAGFPHNVVFDEDDIPAGVKPELISMPDEDYLNAKGDIYSVTLTEKGSYSFYCAPHQGAGMVGKVIVK